MNGAACESLGETLHDLLDGLVVGQHGDDSFGVARRVRRRVRHGRAFLPQRLGALTRSIVDGQAVPGAHQVARDRQAHISSANECKLHVKCHSNLISKPTLRF